MNKTKIYSRQFLSFLVLTIALYLGLVNLNVLPIDKMTALYITLTSVVIFLLGTIIIAPGLNKDAESFTLRFLLLTTIQMLAVFFIIGILAFQKIPDVRTVGLHLTGIVCTLLFIQSALLVKINNRVQQ